ncbi:MAG TPA: hypothetical protein VKQ10_03795 [Spirochaetota bacterium]|nr:hypothetical protein [Spirochaetota bacterium]
MKPGNHINENSNDSTVENSISPRKKFLHSKIQYYRNVLRKQDEELLRRIQKIPDNWEEFEKKKTHHGISITDFDKKRLSEIKKFKSQQLKFESLYINHIMNIENTLLQCLAQEDIPENELDEATESVEIVLVDMDKRIDDFKHLLLAMAKRAVSDLYYLVIAYTKFFKKDSFDFGPDIKSFFLELIDVFLNHKQDLELLNEVQKYNKLLEPYFVVSSNRLGWKIDEFKLKKMLEEVDEKKKFPFLELRSTVSHAFRYKQKMKKNYEFIQYYYNETDGKMFRFNFISQSLAEKLNNGEITPQMYELYCKIRDDFREVKRDLDFTGLYDFGYQTMSYTELLDFVFKAGKIIEFYYLRSYNYEGLQKFRNDIVYYVEEEFYRIHPEINRTM